ncbi:hypothetical protein ASPZODRAFT_107322 [Penicilliopsis zonata CBS 506.65]|uniref:FHA domain-containing protein n=1 Tax=Penicilliopsis zonata CBS 506.65 TaxID=1073090 RepID=A0A1L9SVB1_9EURO|nr:hypothetical protein ASPZODRAFT_107322 [Penicilliopsis zonata CBS 506.65]OJJ51086.1 hypothetical protein ASPZODRAFT_107322 [Penicilliopsis zonata CBS 506.65]
MSASTAALPPDSSSARPGRLRRLSQLRAYTHALSSSSSTSSTPSSAPVVASSAPSGHRSYRNSFSTRVSWLSPVSHTTVQPEASELAPCPEPESPVLARYTSAPQTGSFGFVADPTSESTPSTPSNESDSQPAAPSLMARLRSASAVLSRPLQIPDTGNNSNINNNTNTNGRGADPSPVIDSPGMLSREEGATDLLAGDAAAGSKQNATIRLYPHQDLHQNSRPSLPFLPISRTLPASACVIRVGRYSERDGVPISNPRHPSSDPVGFKSKVVSRKHCEFHYLNGQWHVKDVGSSSGTFLNHMRLSPPNVASRLYPIKDGDIVQLGIDFKGGEEMIFRCVRIRIECNRSWQQQANEFNKNTESLIQNLGKGDTSDYSGCRECSICLGSVLRPYQCLFMAACAHVWHYKCISRLIHTPDYPMFQCPNCRAYTDLSAEVDDTPEFDEKEPMEEQKGVEEHKQEVPGQSEHSAPIPIPETIEEVPPLESYQTSAVHESAGESGSGTDHHSADEGELAATVDRMDIDQADARSGPTTHLPGWQLMTQSVQPAAPPRQTQLRSETPNRSETSDENPLTPRNDSGPLALDGRAVISD